MSSAPASTRRFRTYARERTLSHAPASSRAARRHRRSGLPGPSRVRRLTLPCERCTPPFFLFEFLVELQRFLVFPLLRLRVFFGLGTFAPARRASLNPMAIACLRLVTFFPEPPRSAAFPSSARASRVRPCRAPSSHTWPWIHTSDNEPVKEQMVYRIGIGRFLGLRRSGQGALVRLILRRLRAS